MLFDSKRLLLVSGPCALESEAIVMETAEALAKLQQAQPDLHIIFKGSFDKANRTSLDSPRGPGLELGLTMLAKVKKQYGFKLCTDFHLPEQAAPVAEVCDVLQVPAFLCRQTDLLVAAAQTGKVVKVKKGQFLSPQEMQYVVSKLEESHAKEIWLTERGTTFGYQNLVVDMRSFQTLNQHGHPTIFDATHSVQMPGAGGGTTSGKREFVPALARAALAAGAKGLFMETHPKPNEAISDGPNQIPLAELPEVINGCLKVWRAVR